MSSPETTPPMVPDRAADWSVASLLADPDRCYRAVRSRDRRFDGRIVLAVSSTGIYCRPSCPTPIRPKRANARFYATPAAAQGAGFRACKRCRPDAAPGSPEWALGDELVNRAMRAIAAGEVDRIGVQGLADGLSVSARHLDRTLQARVGAGPLALARARRAHAARRLLEHTDLSMSSVAFAAGFGSIRQFNETVREVYDRTPSQVRAGRGPGAGAARSRGHDARLAGGPTGHSAGAASSPVPIALRLAIRPPFHPEEVLTFLSQRALPGVESGDAEHFARMLDLASGPGLITLRPDGDGMLVEIQVTDLADLTAAVAVAERLCDATCDPLEVASRLEADELLSGSVVARPGRRMPACGDGFEALVRAILGQQVTVRQGITLAGQVVEAAGRAAPAWAPPGLTHLPLEPSAVAEADLSGLGMPGARGRALVAAAATVADGSVSLDAHAGREPTRAALLAVPGVGPWTADYVALRGLADPDAFPIGDVALQRGAAALGMDRERTALLARSQAWRPWRAVAVAHLWAASNTRSAPGASTSRPTTDDTDHEPRETR